MALVLFFFFILVLINLLLKGTLLTKKGIHAQNKVYQAGTGIALVFAVLQAPYFYYYTSGFLALFIIATYVGCLLILTTVLLVPIIQRKKVTLFHKSGVIIAMVIATASFFYGSEIMERMDWKLRQPQRNLIVEKVLSGQLKGETIKLDCFPPISNGGNEIMVDRNAQGATTVTFYVDRGSLDHYSAFVFTTDSLKIREIERKIQSANPERNKKLGEHWFRISK